MPTASKIPASPNSHRPSASIELCLLTRVKPLPVLPNGAPVLLNALSDAALPFNELAATLGNFPTIVARLLSLANSPWSSPASPVTSLDSAIARLGLDTVRSVSIALTIAAPFSPARCAAFSVHRYWCSALLAAHTASRISVTTQSTIGLSSPAARTAGLMHNLGVLWLADALPRETDRALSIAAENPMTSVHEAFMSTCGVSYSHAGAALSDAWQIPQPIASGMAYHLPAPAGTMEEKFARLITLVAAMVSANYNESTTCIDPEFYEILDIDTEVYGQAYDDLERTFPLMQELVDTLFHC